MNKEEYILLRQVSDLFFLVNSGQATKSQQGKFESLLNESDMAMDLYLDLVVTCAGLSEADGLFGLNKSFSAEIAENTEGDQFSFEASNNKAVDDSNVSLRGVDLQGFMSDVSEDDAEDNDKTRDLLEIIQLERTSPAVEIEKPEPVKPKRELIQKVVYSPREKSKLTKFQKFQLAFAACIIGFMIYISYAPVPIPPPVVAELDDSINAVWDDDLEMPDEYGDMVQSRYRLKKGYASIQFHGGAKVTVEAPAELSLMGGGNMELYIGKIYAIVPERAHGFTVTAGGSKVVDLGTEFGVEVDNNNNTQLHVTKGRTVLFAGLLSGINREIHVNAGAAKKVYNDGLVTDIPVSSEKFARRIDSKSNLVLRDQKFNLADVVGGGNGFGTGILNKGIDMRASCFKMFGTKDVEGIDIYDFSYKPFAGHPYIDGVCVPNGGAGPVQISSKGHIFENCPQSAGRIGGGIFNGAFHYYGAVGIPKTQASLGGVTCGIVTNPAISITPNQAITFDLDAVRRVLDGVSILSFSSKAGLSDLTRKYAPGLGPKTSFYVLVDGVVRFSKIDQKVNDDVLEIKVEIKPNDRFLTIMTLQGTDSRTTFEWSLFAEPSLLLE